MATAVTYEQRVARVTELIAADDMAELARYLTWNSTLISHRVTGPSVLQLLRAMPRPAVLRLVQALIAGDSGARVGPYQVGLVTDLAGRLPAVLPDEACRQLLDFALRFQGRYHWALPGKLVVLLVTWQRDHGGVGPEVLQMVRDRAADSQAMRRLANEFAGPPLSPDDPWAARILADLTGLGPGWGRLVGHAGTALSARPSATWTAQANRLLAEVGPDRAAEVIEGWLDLAAQPPQRVPDHTNADTLRGLLWTVGLLPAGARTAHLLATLVEAMLRRIPGVGPAGPKIANAAVGVLGRLDGEPALAQLARLSTRVTYAGTRNEIGKALDARATALGLSRDEVEELAVPEFGLTGVGGRQLEFGGCRAELAVRAGRAEVDWYAASGRPVKSPPAAVRRDHPAALSELKVLVKDVSAMLVAQRDRLDRLFLARREWPLATWRERYLDHPLVGVLARRLIWLVDDVACGYAGGALRTLADAEVGAADGAVVRLWHPIGRPVAEVIAWRDWLERHDIVQPFKQAHREVYLLTPAEERTGDYSNRFAGHIVRQHQLHALAAARGWRNRLRLMVDDMYPPATRELARWGLRAEFWIEGVGEHYDTDTTETGSYLRLTTDQVRFYPIGARGNWAHACGGGYQPADWDRSARSARLDRAEPVGLAQVPPLVFSEIMRDVDLFVGVASVGNDPTWADGGPRGRFRDYWNDYSFGELSATAQTRRDLLARLLPRLAVGSRATVRGRFLVVQGDLRTYKIHLGSGNILMSPDDRYLCIVAGPATGGGQPALRLPFEGDGTLSVILSKAMLLARDTEITDPTITRQIRT